MKKPNSNEIIDRKLEFGKQLIKYREVTSLTQEEYSHFVKLARKVVHNAESGTHSLGIENLEKHASAFGVPYYIMGNPNIEPPTYDELPEELKAYIEQVKIDRKKKKAEPQQKISSVVDREIPTFLATAKTALEFVNHLKQLALSSTSQNITNLLTSKKRNKIVTVIPAEQWGGDVDKYIHKLELN